MSSIVEPTALQGGTAVGAAELAEPTEPDPSTWYKHKVSMGASARELWNRRDMIYTLAERDLRSTYKQAALGFGWALISPLINLIIFSIIFSRITTFKVPGVPYPIYMYAGLIIWGYFTGSLASGSSAILGNIALMQKTNFPRECFPLSQMLEQFVYTAITVIPLAGLMLKYGFLPHWQTVFFPILVVIEVIFTAGVVLTFGSAVIYIRDLTNLQSLIIQLGLFVTPILWPFDKIPVSWNGIPVRAIYSFLNPIGPIIDSFRNIVFLGKYPDWSYLGIATVSSSIVFYLGYRLFKHLEVNFADIA